MDIKTYLSGFDKAEKINKGMAGDEKYHCQRGAEEYLLRIAEGEDYDEKKRELRHMADQIELQKPELQIKLQKILSYIYKMLMTTTF